jgi:hypothetical protein
MIEMLGYCGFLCDICPAYHKNIKSEEDKKKLSGKWFKYFGFKVSPENISCVGCRNEGNHPDEGCPVRPCAIKKNVRNCAYCDDFDCDNLKSRVDFVESNVNIDIEKIPEEDYKIYIEPYFGKKRLLEIREKFS